MNKKFIALGVAALLLMAVVVPGAFAASDNNDKTVDNAWFDQMFERHTQWVDQAVKNGQIDEQQAKAWKEHFDYMKDFHKQNGMMGGGMMNGMMGGYGNSDGGWGMMGGGGYPGPSETPSQSQSDKI